MDMGGRRSNVSMNSSSSGQNTSTMVRPDSYTTALAKNITVVLLGLIINYLNGIFIHTFRSHQILYRNPRYILFIHLVANDMLQLTTTVLLFVLSYVFYRINALFCCFLMGFSIFATLNTPLNLAVMAVECYVAVCFPLRHPQWCTVKVIYVAISCTWVLSVLSFVPDIFYLAAIKPALFFSNIMCDLIYFVQSPALIKKREATWSLYMAGVWLVLIYTYIQIFLAARSAKTNNIDTKKARNTILLHSFQLLLCMLTYVYSSVQNIFLTMFPTIYVNVVFVWYVVVQVLPRFLSPMVYGLRDKIFREHLKKYRFKTIVIRE